MAQENNPQGTQQIGQYIKGANFPCKKQELEQVAQKNDAPKHVIDNLRQLPDRRFNNLNEVQDAARQVETTTR